MAGGNQTDRTNLENGLTVYQLALAPITKCHRLDALNNRNLFSHSFGGWKAQDEGASFWLEPPSQLANNCLPAVS